MSASKKTAEVLVIAPPNFQVCVFKIRGVAPLVQNKFSAKAREQIRKTQGEGSTAKKGRKREPKDFQAAYRNAMHIATEGWHGIPAAAFRNAMISACKTVGFQMTRAKLGAFIIADGFDEEGTPLVRITKGEPTYYEGYVRVQNKPDIHPRPMWAPGWESEIRVRFDADMFTITDIANLLMRVGLQVGICEGRPDSKSSAGMGWGLFELIGQEGKS